MYTSSPLRPLMIPPSTSGPSEQSAAAGSIVAPSRNPRVALGVTNTQTTATSLTVNSPLSFPIVPLGIPEKVATLSITALSTGSIVPPTGSPQNIPIHHHLGSPTSPSGPLTSPQDVAPPQSPQRLTVEDNFSEAGTSTNSTAAPTYDSPSAFLASHQQQLSAHHATALQNLVQLNVPWPTIRQMLDGMLEEDARMGAATGDLINSGAQGNGLQTPAPPEYTFKGGS
ncbi:hypothetical protein FRB94_003617 [Tulasnella sp. JGI-2019a]|nr:hypothetical protein FRB94_003617 [Tulasnella sp. JGI-2019a]KAG9008911.1 hypothetical protein FRB93_005961 [Tulasnella sp. JGI-2019a]KAG9038232.1 hypothetical protein FRB95_002193 [Tulasnella sp. JGI-2019a]